MSRLTISCVAGLLAMTPVFAGAQTRTVPGKTERLTATVDAIDVSNRQITLTKPDKTKEVIYVPSDVKRFDTLKVGDKITATYYENIVLQVKAPGDKSVDTAAGGVVRGAGPASAATASHQRTITATITAIDPKVPSITFTGPSNWNYSTRVRDKEALAKVKVGDKVDITWTEALLVSLDEPK